MTDLSSMSTADLLAAYNAEKSKLAAARPAPKLAVREQMQLDDARDTARNAIEVQRDLRRFSNLNAAEKSGGLNAIPLVPTVRAAFDPEVAQMNAITARFAPSQRTPGSGTTSDRDLSLFLAASPTIKAPRQANDAIVERGRQEAIRRQAYSDFLDRYAQEHGSLIGADEAFRTKPVAGVDEPIDLSGGQSRSTIPYGALYRDPQGNMRRNDNGDRGNPILKKLDTAKLPRKGATGFRVLKVE